MITFFRSSAISMPVTRALLVVFVLFGFVRPIYAANDENDQQQRPQQIEAKFGSASNLTKHEKLAEQAEQAELAGPAEQAELAKQAEQAELTTELTEQVVPTEQGMITEQSGPIAQAEVDESSGQSNSPPPQQADTHAQQAGTHAEEPGLFDINPWVLLAQFCNFFVLLWALNKWFFKPIGLMLDQRRSKIGNDLESAQKASVQAEKYRLELMERLTAAENEARHIRQQALIRAEQERTEILAEAEEKIKRRLDAAEQELLQEKQKAWAHLRENLVLLTMQATEKVVEASLDDKMHRHLIATTIENLERAIDEKQQQ